jgi:hypothetical protein
VNELKLTNLYLRIARDRLLKKTNKLGHSKLYDFTVGFLFLLIKKYNKMEKESSCHKTAFLK